MSDPMSSETRNRLLDMLKEHEDLAVTILGQVSAGRHLFVNLGLEGMAELYKVAEFTALLRFDIACLFSDYIRYELSERAHLYARFLILTIYESTKTYRELLGGNLQRKLSRADGSVLFLKRVREVHKALSRVSDDVAKRYGDVRHAIGAHRDPDAMKQLARVRSIGGQELAELYERFTRTALLLDQLIRDFTGVVAQTIQQHVQPMFLSVGSDATITVNVREGSGSSVGALDPLTLTWSSADNTVAVVDAMGIVRAIGKGCARVTFEHSSDAQIAGGALILVGDRDELARLDQLWRSLFRPVE